MSHNRRESQSFVTAVKRTFDSEYVAVNATNHIQCWEASEWTRYDRNQGTVPIKNRDLWEALLTEIRKLQRRGVAVRFWRIPRESNLRADEFAKKAVAFSARVLYHIVKPLQQHPVNVEYIPWRMNT